MVFFKVLSILNRKRRNKSAMTMKLLCMNSKTKALRLLKGNPIPSQFFYLRRCCSSQALDSVSEFEKMVQNRCQSNDFSVSEALKLVISMAEMRPVPSIWTFNRLIGSLSKLNQCSTVVSVYKTFVRSVGLDFEYDVFTLTIVAKCLCVSHSVKSGFSVLSVAIKAGIRPDSHLMNALLEGLCKEGSSMASAMELFEKMADRKGLCDEVTYGTIINGFCKSGEARKALSVLETMIDPNLCCFTAVIDGLFKERRTDEALGLFRDMISRGVRPDVRVYSIVICSLCKNERLDEAVSMFESMSAHSVVPDFMPVPSKGIEPDIFIYTSLIAALSKSGRFEEASWFFSRMIEKGVTLDLAAFRAILLPLCEIGRAKDAVRQFEAMIDRGTKPNIVNYNALINGLCRFKHWNDVDNVLENMKRRGVSQDVMTYTIRVEALLKAGKVRKALDLFEKMTRTDLKPPIATYSSLLWRLCQSRQVYDSERLFNKMASQKNMLPNEKTCSALLDLLIKKGTMEKAQKVADKIIESGDSHCVVTYYDLLMKGYCKKSEVDKAHEIFDRMKSMGISPNLEAYCTLVDGYVAVGRVTSALKLLREMVEKGLTPNDVAQSILKKAQAKRSRSSGD